MVDDGIAFSVLVVKHWTKGDWTMCGGGGGDGRQDCI